VRAPPLPASAALTQRRRGFRSYIGLRNGDCDVAAAAVELDYNRATCGASCPDPSVTPLQDLPGADYALESYRARLNTICCLDYGVPHLPANGFALFSKAVTQEMSLFKAIFSVEVLNAATPILIGIICFGWVMYILERHDNKQFHAQHGGVYFGFVSIATFGYGDLAPVTRLGRLLTVFWCITSILSISALTSVVSARLTVNQLLYRTIDDLKQLRPSQICVEAVYPAVHSYLLGQYSLHGNLAAAGVMLGTVQSCADAVRAGTVLAYLSDQPLLSWLAYEYYATGDLYVSDTIRTNPLTLAYPAGSSLRRLADAAVIGLLTNITWTVSRERLEESWFGRKETVLALQAKTPVQVPTLVAACVLLGVWLLGMAWTVSRKLVVAARSHDDHPIQRVLAALSTRSAAARRSEAKSSVSGSSQQAVTAEPPPPEAPPPTAYRAGKGSPRIEMMDI
jgi:hypothetical protein